MLRFGRALTANGQAARQAPATVPSARGTPPATLSPMIGAIQRRIANPRNPNRKHKTMISTRAHGILDYLIGIALIAAPWLFGFAFGGAETWTAVLVGAAIILYSLMTDYELGAAKIIPMKAHLALDIVAGLFLAVSPWLLGYATIVWGPHVVVGIVMIGTGLITEKVPRYHLEHRRPTTHHHAHR